MRSAFVAAVLLHLAGLHFSGKPADTPHVVCGIRTVSYRFVGSAGQEFVYDGDAYRLPANGTIELIASPQTSTYEVANRTMPLDTEAADQFGTRTVRLPAITAGSRRTP